MTKEEAIDMIINDYKDGNQSAMSDYCDRTRCSGCPFDSDICTDEVSNTLIDRLLKAEEHQETNLEHFRGTVVFDKANGIVHIHLINGWEKNYTRPHKGAIDWFLSPYEEPPKPKYKLSKFEYDLLKSYGEETRSTDIFCYFSLIAMREKGYFKDIHVTATFGDVLDNCEVTTNE